VQAWMQQAKRDEAHAWKAARAGRKLAA